MSRRSTPRHRIPHRRLSDHLSAIRSGPLLYDLTAQMAPLNRYVACNHHRPFLDQRLRTVIFLPPVGGRAAPTLTDAPPRQAIPRPSLLL
jgi:hypothetical protein